MDNSEEIAIRTYQDGMYWIACVVNHRQDAIYETKPLVTEDEAIDNAEVWADNHGYSLKY